MKRNGFIFILMLFLMVFFACLEYTGTSPQEKQSIKISIDDKSLAEDNTKKEPALDEHYSSEKQDNKNQLFEPLNTENERRIIEDFKIFCNYKYPNNNEQMWWTPRITKYCGTYNDCVTVIFDLPAFAAIRKDIIAGIIFGYPDSNTIKVWNKGLFYELGEAYDLGFLSIDNLEKIAYYHYKGGIK